MVRKEQKLRTDEEIVREYPATFNEFQVWRDQPATFQAAEGTETVYTGLLLSQSPKWSREWEKSCESREGKMSRFYGAREKPKRQVVIPR